MYVLEIVKRRRSCAFEGARDPAGVEALQTRAFGAIKGVPHYLRNARVSAGSGLVLLNNFMASHGMCLRRAGWNGSLVWDRCY